MVRITRDNAREFSPHAFVSEASELGLPPGMWPDVLETDLGNRLLLFRVAVDDVGARYRQEFGCVRLSILND